MKTIKALFLVLVLSVLTYSSFACVCIPEAFTNRYQRSGVVVTARILKVEPDKDVHHYDAITIEVIDLYKGKVISHLKVENARRSSCGLPVEENSIWLFYTIEGQAVDECSGSKQIDRVFSEETSPRVQELIKASIRQEIEILNYLKKHQSHSENPYELLTKRDDIFNQELSGFKEDRSYAIYEVTIKEDLNITSVRDLVPFNNLELSSKLKELIRERLRVTSSNRKQLPTPSSLLLVYYYYPSENEYPSQVSAYEI